MPVLAPSQIYALEPFHVVLLRRGLHVIVGRTPTVLDRPGWTQIPLNTAATDPWDTATTLAVTTAGSGRWVQVARLAARTGAAVWARLTSSRAGWSE